MGDSDPLGDAPHALATTVTMVTQLLQLAASLCYDMFEAQVMCEQIRRRLDAIAAALREAPASSPRSSEATSVLDAVHTRFAATVTQFHDFLARSARKDTVYRIVSSRVVVQQCRSFHEAIDALLATEAALAQEAQNEVHSWTNRFENARENLWISLTKLSRDRMTMMRDLLDRTAQEDALTRIMYEYKRPESSGASPTELQVIQHAFNTITRMSRAKVPIVPTWFLALYDIDVFEREALAAASGRSVVVSVHRGTYRGASVLVTFVSLNPAQLAELVRTMTIWSSVSPSPHVLRIVGACHVGDPFIVVEDVRSTGSLAAFAATAPESLWAKLHDAALGLQALHDQSIVHGALTPSHLLIAGDDATAMIADNVMSALCSDSTVDKDAQGLRRKAPELQRNDSSKAVTMAVDVYAFGMCILDAIASSSKESSSSAAPSDPTVLATTADATGVVVKPASVTSEQWELVQRMCAEDPEQRPEMAEVVAALAAFAANEAAKEDKGAAIADTDGNTPSKAQEGGTVADDGEEVAVTASASVAMDGESATTAEQTRNTKALAREAKKRAKAAKKEAKRARKMSQQGSSKTHCIVM